MSHYFQGTGNYCNGNFLRILCSHREFFSRVISDHLIKNMEMQMFVLFSELPAPALFFWRGTGGRGYGITMANYHSDYDRIASFPEMINCEEYNEYGNYNL